MKDYLKMHANQAAYETWLGSSDFVTPNISTITGSESVLYNHIPASYNILDILWSDGTTTQTVRPTTDNVTPIGLCVIPTGFLGNNEKARFMALKVAGGSSDGMTVGNATGSTTFTNQNLSWAKSSSMDVASLTNYSQFVSDNQNNFGYFVSYGESDASKTQIYTTNDTWVGLEPNNTFTNYALGDINGKQNTTIVSALGSLSNYPAFASVLNYYTPGTQAGDWYLPAFGELAVICVNRSRINNILANISQLYSSDCLSNINNTMFWSSTESNSGYAFATTVYSGSISSDLINKARCVIPMLQK